MNSFNTINNSLVNKKKSTYSTFKTYVGVSTTSPTITISSAFTGACALAIDSSLNIYLVESGSNKKTSKIVTTTPSISDFLTGLTGAYSLAIDINNNVYTADTTLTGPVYKNQTKTAVFSLPRVDAIVFDNSNNVFLGTAYLSGIGGKVFYYQYNSSNGSYSAQVQILGDGATPYPTATTAAEIKTGSSISGLFINNGKLYVCKVSSCWIITMNLSDIYSNNATPSNIPITNFAGTGASATSGSIPAMTKATDVSLNYPYGIAFDKNNNAYIADFSGGSIKKVDTSGYITNFFDSNAKVGMRPPSNFKPVGICCDKNNNKIYVSDNYNGCIYLIT